VLELAHKEHLGPRMIRVVLTGAELEGFEIGEPGASVRLLIPTPGSAELVMPEWNGNEFLFTDGNRPIIRTFTPRAMVPDELVLDIVVHQGGAASQWATAAEPGAPVAISGPGRGYEVDELASEFILLGDETAVPAISQLLESIAGSIPVGVDFEVAEDFGQIEMPEHPGATITWHHSRAGEMGDAMLAALQARQLDATTRIWCAGEAATMHRIRGYLFKKAGVPRSRATVRGYWKARE
jgi:NADPH-dependent ferric siderophore reductase